MCSLENQSKVKEFYAGKTLLVTGVTGFVGKVLVEKLLRSCPDIRRIYLLVREKKGESPEDRLRKILAGEIFSRTKQCTSEIGEKLSIVHGDLCRPKVGLNNSDEVLLIEEVDVVLHCASTIKFDEKLKISVPTNVGATRELCLLAQQMKNLEAFVYVSTAYTNCEEKGQIPEIVRAPPICPDKLLALVELLDDSTMESITPSLLKSKPNTYILTKSAAEEVINRFRSTLPIAILRPSNVTASVSEPVPGWIDGLHGPTAVIVGIMAGLMRTYRWYSHVKINNVPVDYTVNAIIALAYSVAIRSRKPEDFSLPVVNCVSPSSISLTGDQLMDMIKPQVWRYPSSRPIWFPTVYFPKGPWAAAVQKLLLHRLPATIVDMITSVCGKPTSLRKLYDRLDKFVGVMEYFSLRRFEFEERNAMLLWETLEPQDQQLFPFNMADMNWQSYYSDYVQGCRLYVLKEDPLTIPQARKKFIILYCIHIIAKVALRVLALKLAWSIFKFLRGKSPPINWTTV